jgi:hypothetical protein
LLNLHLYVCTIQCIHLDVSPVGLSFLLSFPLSQSSPFARVGFRSLPLWVLIDTISVSIYKVLAYSLINNLLYDTERFSLDNLTLTSTNSQVSRMIKKSLLAPVLTMCFVQIISTALITYIFPFVASCKSVLMSSLTRSLAIDECRRARGPDLCRLGRQYGFNRRCCWTSHCKFHQHSGPASLNDRSMFD